MEPAATGSFFYLEPPLIDFATGDNLVPYPWTCAIINVWCPFADLEKNKSPDCSDCKFAQRKERMEGKSNGTTKNRKNQPKILTERENSE